MTYLYDLKDKYNCCFIKGNKEDYWIDYRKGKDKEWQDNNSTTGSLLYTYTNLTDNDFDFFENLNFVSQVNFEGCEALTICHGSPHTVNEKMLYEDKRTAEIMKQDKNKYILCGHTHIQTEYANEGKYMLNPGSVGLPLHSAGKTQFMILQSTANGWDKAFISLDYDKEKVIEDLHAAELHIKAPYWCKVTENMLRNGDVSHAQVLFRAMDIGRQKYGVCIYPDIPEDCWRQAVEEMRDC